MNNVYSIPIQRLVSKIVPEKNLYQALHNKISQILSYMGDLFKNLWCVFYKINTRIKS